MKNVNKILETLSLSESGTREDIIKSIIRTPLLESKDPVSLTELNENIHVIYDITPAGRSIQTKTVRWRATTLQQYIAKHKLNWHLMKS